MDELSAFVLRSIVDGSTSAEQIAGQIVGEFGLTACDARAAVGYLTNVVVRFSEAGLISGWSA